MGFDLGGAVATGFAAKHPELCRSLALLAPAGIRFQLPLSEWQLKSQPKPLAAYALSRTGVKNLQKQQLESFYDRDMATTHHHLVEKQQAMLAWQLEE